MSVGLIIVYILLALVAAALLWGEFFLVPGFGLAGILGFGTVGVAEYILLMRGQTTMAITFAVVTITAFCLIAIILNRKGVAKKVGLSSEIDSQARKLPEGITVGSTGVTRSRLALKGTVEVQGKVFEATSEQGFLDQDLPIFVSRIDKDVIYVSLDRRTERE